MREIKFRSWLKAKKKMLNDFTILDNPYIPKEENVLMQYTGLKDKNGVEIYEGDIVHYCTTDWIDGYPVESEEKREVAYSVGCYWLIDNKGDDVLFLIHDEDCELEVIGNIYENPELLEVLK